MKKLTQAWKSVLADAHVAQSEALEYAADVLDSVTDALDAALYKRVSETTSTLRNEAQKHEESATALRKEASEVEEVVV